MKEIIISSKVINENSPCFIIAEAGVNHNGSIELAKKLIDIAVDSGVDAVKFQTWITEEIVTKEVEQAEYQKENTGTQESQFDMLKKLELKFEDFRELKKYCEEKNIIFLSTPDDEKSAEFLFELGISAFKIGSGELTNTLLLEKIAQKNLPMIVSTGMATLEEIELAKKSIESTGNHNIMLLHCTSEYPTPKDHINLRAMNKLKQEFDTLVGYSDHSIGILVPQLAVASGAKMIEKHFTFDKNAEGPDHKASLDPQELKEMVIKLREVEKILGKSDKNPTSQEEKTKLIVRKTLVAERDILEGERISKNLLALKRSNGQLSCKDINQLIGKRVKNKIIKNQAISLEDLE